MSLRYVVRALLVAGFMPSAAFALGLGEIHLHSSLNSPLEADIDLSASAEELDSLKLSLAPRESFTRYGLDYPSFLGSVDLRVAKDAAGHDVIRVRSAQGATEPFATLLVEATWARGRLVREYTVLLDPPAYTGATGNQAAVAAPTGAQSTQSAPVQRAPAPQPAAPAPQAPVAARPAQSPTPTPTPAPAPAPRPAAAPPPAPAGDYSVRRGDSLSAIIARRYPNNLRERALVAAYQANPGAFAGNMNVLKAGATLHLPDDAAVAAIGLEQASSEVLSQYRAWSPTRPGGQVKLVAPSEPAPRPAAVPAPAPAPATRPGAVAGKPAAPSPGDAKRMAELQNPALASLQKNAAQPAPSAAAPPAKVPAAAAKPAAPSPAPVPAKAPPAAAKAPPAAAQPAPTPAPAPAAGEAKKPLPKVAPPKPATPGITDLVSEYGLYIGGGLVLVFGGLLGMRWARKRQDRSLERTFDRFTTPAPEPAARSSRASETQPIKPILPPSDGGMVVEETGSHEVLQPDPASLPFASVSTDSAAPFDSAVSLEQGDPMAEADFHMAYGLYDQAADIVRLATQREPGRRDLKHKLLEVYFVWGNKDEFLRLARELAGSRDQGPAGEWEKVVIMGRQIAADDPLFAAGGDLGKAASAGVDLNLEGGQNHVDFDLLGEPTLATESPASVDLDLGALPAHEPDVAATGEAPTLGDTGVDFILDDPARGGDGSPTQRLMATETLDGGSNSFSPDAPTVEQPRPELEHGTLRQKLDATAHAALAAAAGDPTTELSIDDLGLDVNGATAGLQTLSTLGPESDSAPTMLANLGDLGHEAADTRETREMPAVENNASGTWLLTDKDFSEVMPDLVAAAGGDGPTQVMTSLGDTGLHLTNELAALKSGGGKGVDLDISATGAMKALDLDLSAGQTIDEPAGFGETQRLDAVAGSDVHVDGDGEAMEPATMSEVGTKLDLARAYMDMGDPEGARSILEEVLAEGSASQKTEARRLIDSLPG